MTARVYLPAVIKGGGPADLGALRSFDLAGAGHSALDQPAVAEKVLNRLEAINVVNLI